MRDYKEEYKKFQSKPWQRENNRKRKRDRYKMAKKGLVTKGDGVEVHHVNGVKSDKLSVISSSKNKGMKNEGGRKKGVSHDYPNKRKSRKYVKRNVN
tara:strand:+ start:355 stop:645 length:291 start_codon:yes stop_codon:yes gene_type:complete